MSFLSSCGGDWYLETAPKQSNYIEEPKEGTLSTALSKSSGNTIIIDGDPESFKTKGQGFYRFNVPESVSATSLT